VDWAVEGSVDMGGCGLRELSDHRMYPTTMNPIRKAPLTHSQGEMPRRDRWLSS